MDQLPTRTGWWEQYGGAPTRCHLSNASLSPPLRLKWKAKTGGYLFDSPLVAGDRVLIGGRDVTYRCWSISTGKEIWCHEIDPKGIRSDLIGVLHDYPVENGSAITGDSVVVSSTRGYVQSLSLESGERLWQSRLGEMCHLGQPLVTPFGVVVSAGNNLGSPDYSLVCLSPASGEERWRARVDERCVCLAEQDGIGVAVLSMKMAVLTAFRVESGEVVWKRDFGQRQAGDMLIRDGVVVISVTDEGLLGLDLRDGTERWRIPGATSYGPPSTG